MKNTFLSRLIIIATLIFTGTQVAFSQIPGGPGGPPMGPGPVIGIGNGPDPAPGSAVYNPGTPLPPPPQPQPPANWGSPWSGGPGPVVVNAPLSSPNWQNSGVTNVVACGYDAQGVWRTIPLRVSYVYNGAQYNVTVDSAWNPWTDCWNYGIDVPAFNTDYFLNGTTFNFYTNLSTGTWYFNL